MLLRIKHKAELLRGTRSILVCGSAVHLIGQAEVNAPSLYPMKSHFFFSDHFFFFSFPGVGGVLGFELRIC
jgi:hypothetical protein